MNIGQILMDSYATIHDKIFDFKTVKLKPSAWTEKNVYLTSDVSRFQGYYSYDKSPYAREIIDTLSPDSPIKTVAVMKCAQAGITQGVIIPGICWIIDEAPAGTLFMAGDKELARNSVRTRLDPVIKSAGIQHLIRPNVTRKRNQRTGDTDFSKEFAGGQLIVEGSKNADKLRQFSVKYIFADDWEAAPYSDKNEGTVRDLLEGRATSFGNMAKIFYISTPAVQQSSNIEPVYEMGDQRKWHWRCPHCATFISVEWRVQLGPNQFAGIQYTVIDGHLDPKSVHYKCQKCSGKIYEKQKFDLNLSAKWIPTATPTRPEYRSYYMNALIIPPGFTSWVDLVYQWLEANPVNGPVNIDKLKTFINIRLGQTWEEKGETPRVHQLMQNTGQYRPGIIPDTTSKSAGNGTVVLLTLAVDLNGIMAEGNEDVRVDWEIVAHCFSGVTYSIDHGSIGTFKRARDKTKYERDHDGERDTWTYRHGVPFSVWPTLEKIMNTPLVYESGKEKKIMLTLIDTGNFTHNANIFINAYTGGFCFGIKGQVEQNHRSVNKDTPVVRKSREQNKLYILEVNLIKDKVAANIKLTKGSNGYQPPGFMNFPEPRDGKYTMNSFFVQYEGEKRIPIHQGEQVIGYKWDKKNNQAQNHYWDVRIYNEAGKYVFIDLFRQSNPKKYKDLKSWSDFATLFG